MDPSSWDNLLNVLSHGEILHYLLLEMITFTYYRSEDNLHRTESSLPSTTYYVDDKSYCSISIPTYPTMNGKPLQTVTRERKPNTTEMSLTGNQASRDGCHSDRDRNDIITQAGYIDKPEDNSAHGRNVSGRMTTIAGENVFVNYGFTPEQTSMYSNHWNYS